MWVVPFDETESLRDGSMVGGKAVGLARLIEAGFRVPTGYVVTTLAFRRSLSQALFGLKTPEAMREAVSSSEIPVEIERAIRDIHESMFSREAVAVRSSATDEDTLQHSFAGQLESVLEVRGVDELLKAIRTVWASYFSSSNLLYRGRISLAAEPGQVAVVVQKMLSPRAAGVMFTIDPLSERRDRAVVSASAGLGGPVVAGLSAETAYIDLGRSEAVRHVPADKQAEYVLGADDIRALALAASRVNELFDGPQDLEWALDEIGLALLQCRPITTIGRGKLQPSVWSNINVGEALPGVATPMTWSIIWSFAKLGFENAFGALGLKVPADYELVSSFRGRVYLNVTQFASIASQVPFFTVDSLLAVAGGGGREEILRVGYKKRSKASFLAKLPVTVTRMGLSQLLTPARAGHWRERFRRRREEFFKLDLSVQSRAELLKQLEELNRLFEKTGIVMLACGSNFLSSYVLTRTLLERWGGQPAAERESLLFSGLRGVASAEPGMALLDMARFVSERAELVTLFERQSAEEILRVLPTTNHGRALQKRLQVFFDEYGLRAPREAEISTPRWRERPEFLISIIKRHLKLPYLPSSEELESERERIRQETTEMIRPYFRTGLGVLFRGILKVTQNNTRLREGLRSCVTDTLAMYRHFFLEVGRRMVEERLLSGEEEVFFLTRQEVQRYLRDRAALADVSLLVCMRRACFVAFQESSDPPDTFVFHTGQSIPEAKQKLPLDTPLLEGLAASPGRITGPARVVSQFDDHQALHPGEILVAPYTDVGWTPLFLIASGVVTDMGGPLSHAAVVAREYGIPAVVNAKEATALIRTGDLITVDGHSGRVYLKR